VSTHPTLSLGPYRLNGRFALSPMAEFTSWPLRLLCQEFGAVLSCAEMVKARFVVARDADTLRLLSRRPDERLCGGQLCGADPAQVAAAAEILVRELRFPFVDLNMAGPVRRILFEGAGGALTADPARVEKLVRATVQAIAPVPVTVKLRAGLDEGRVTAVEAAQAAEAGGAALVAIHPRTVKQGYSGRADHRVTAAVRAALRIPVMGGGDLRTAQDAVRLLRETGCDLAFFGRAAIGDPWIFSRATRLWEGAGEAEACASMEMSEVLRVFRRHVEGLLELLGEERACLHVRRLAGEYAGRISDPLRRSEFRGALSRAERWADVEAVVSERT
jgi:tRNA-dihydrouridine synthase B